MICPCCKNNVKEGKTSCNVCGMTLLAGGDVSKDIHNSVVNDLRNKLLGDTSLLLKIYNYEIKNGSVNEQGTETIKLFDALQLNYDVVKLFKQEFEEVSSNRPFTLELIVRKGQTSTPYSLQFKPEKPVSHKFIGAQMMPGFRCRVFVGADNDFVSSEEFSLI